jgi:hypothetical protein
MRVVALLLGVGSLLLALESAGRAERYRMRALDDARPAPGLLLNTARLLAILMGNFPLAVVAILTPFAWRITEASSLLIAPSLIFLAVALLPLVVVGASSGLAARSVVRKDLPALVLGFVPTLAATWYLVWVGRIEELFIETSRTLGILLPLQGFLSDAVLCVVIGLGLLGVASLSARRTAPATTLRSLQPPIPSRSSIRPLFARVRVIPGRLLNSSVVISLLMMIGGAYAAVVLGDRAVQSIQASAEAVTSLAWEDAVEPPGLEGIIFPPRIVEREWDLRNSDEGLLRGRLTVASGTSVRQAVMALSLGPATRLLSVARTDGGAVTRLDQAAQGAPAVIVLRMEPPLEPDVLVDLVIESTPFAGAARDWERTRHPLYRTFETLGTWYGEGLIVDYRLKRIQQTAQPAPFTLRLPTAEGIQWVCGPAAFRLAEGAAVLEHRTPGIPNGLFASPTVAVERSIGETRVIFHVLPEHADVAASVLEAWEDRIARLVRLFGPSPVPIVLSETPRQVANTPLSLTSATLDQLEVLLPKYADFDEPSAPVFDATFVRLHKGLVEAWIDSAFPAFEDQALLRDALIQYIHEWGLLRGNTRSLPRLLRRDFVLVPWEFARQPGDFPFDVLAADEPGYRGPALRALRATDLRPAPPQRLMGFHHMLRGLVGDESYVRGLRHLVQEKHGSVLTLELYREAMEQMARVELEPFFDQWLLQGVLPRLELLEAEVLYAEDPETRGYLYTTRAITANRGDGRLEVPVVLDTDGDRVETTIVLEENEEREISFTTLERPLSIALDPRGWLVQMPAVDPATKKAVRPVLYLKRVRELADGGTR